MKAFGFSFDVDFYNSSSDHGAQPSGAYIFRPETGEKTRIKFDKSETFESDLVTETTFSSGETDWASVVVRQYLGDPHFEVEWLAGPLPALGSGIEVVMTYKAVVEENPASTGANDSGPKL